MKQKFQKPHNSFHETGIHLPVISGSGDHEAMNRYVKHIVVPLVAPALIVGLNFTPVTVFGCVTRGLIAVTIALVSAVCAFVATGFGFAAQRRHDQTARWWILSAILLALPLALLLGPLG